MIDDNNEAAGEDATEKEDKELEALLHKIFEERGMDFRDYKRASLKRRIQKRLDANSLKSYAEYMKLLDAQPDEYSKLFDTLLINVTEFFRDPEAWDVLGNEVILRIVASKKKGDSIRVWSAGCATGEEPYSVAIKIAEALGEKLKDFEVRIYATDIDESALTAARRGVYSSDKLKNVNPGIIERYFSRENGDYKINRNIRQMVVFGKQNLVTDAPISHLDLLVCRNVLIYFNVDLQNKLLLRFHYALNKNGYAFFGKSESMLVGSKLFRIINKKWRIFQKIPEAISALPPNERRYAIVEEGLIDQAVMEARREIKAIDFYNQSIIQSISQGIIVVDLNSYITTWNRASEELWGIKAEYAIGRDIFEIGLGERIPGISEKVADAKRERRVIKFEDQEVFNMKGEKMYLNISFVPLIDPNREMRGCIIICEDVTQNKLLRDDLKKSNDELQVLNERLEATNEELESTNEELQTTTEELQSTTEELETSNEELQSTNEELETSNEELRSINEELETTNEELKDRTEQLDAANVYNRTIIESIDQAIIVLDRNSVITTWNRAAEKMLGLGEREAIGSNFYSIEPALSINSNEMKQRIKQVVESRKPYGMETIECNTINGQKRFVTFTIIPLQSQSGDAYLGTMLIMKDITKERGLEEARHRLVSIVNSVDDAIYSCDANGVIQSWNLGAKKMFGFSPEEVIGRPVSILFPVPEEQNYMRDKIMKKESIIGYEISHARKEGAPNKVSLTISPMKDMDDHITGVAFIARLINSSHG